MLRLNSSYVFYDESTGYPYVSLASAKNSRIIELRPPMAVKLDGGVSAGFAPSDATKPLVGTTFKVRVTCIGTAVSTGVNMIVKTSDSVSSGALVSPRTIDTIPIGTGAKGEVLVDTVISKMAGNFVQFSLPGSGVGSVLVEVFPIER